MVTDGRYRTVCAHDCPDSCGLIGTCRNGRLVELEGRDDNPYTRGFICHKGRRWVRELRGPDRLTSPLLRQGNTFVSLPWDEALDMTAHRIRAAVERHDHRSFLFYEGWGNLLLGNVIQRLLPLLLGGGTMVTGSLCGVEGKVGLARSYGTVGRDRPLSALDSASILLWGRNPAENGVHFLSILHDARHRGARLGTIDIRATPTTAVSDSSWIVRPGSDLILALYLCHEALLRKGEPAAPNTGFSAFRAICAQVSADDARQATGLSAEALHALENFIFDRPPLSIWTGYGLQRTHPGADIVHAVDALGFLLGNHGVPGGGVWFDQEDDGLLPENAVSVPGVQPRFIPRPSLGPCLLTADPPVEAAMIVRGNPVLQCPDAGAVLAFLKQCPFSVCLDWHMSATARACTLVLPVTVFLERGGDYVMSYFHDLLQKTSPVADPPQGARDELDVIRAVASRLHLPDKPFVSALSRLAAVEQDPGLTPVGEGMWRLQERPRIQGPFHFPVSVPVPDATTGMLRLITVHVRDYVNGMDAGQVHARTLPPVASIAARLACDRHVVEGQTVMLTNALGSLPVRVHVNRNIADDTVVLPQGVEGVNRLVTPDVTAAGNSCINDTWVTMEASGR